MDANESTRGNDSRSLSQMQLNSLQPAEAIEVIPYRRWTTVEVAPDLTVMQGRPEGVPQPRERTIIAGDSDACASGKLWEGPALRLANLRAVR